ncbi:hypothetical protein E2C01_033121 [Portunus trituberculatus]|uniref:Uncharacterized protein n=1 Tax=Portunus trituberculatus TaxID=210409 RepID=A0A5B7EX05_PORTR|nr:hypothetical protein [Portunus trituberculatus]
MRQFRLAGGFVYVEPSYVTPLQLSRTRPRTPLTAHFVNHADTNDDQRTQSEETMRINRSRRSCNIDVSGNNKLMTANRKQERRIYQQYETCAATPTDSSDSMNFEAAEGLRGKEEETDEEEEEEEEEGKDKDMKGKKKREERIIGGKKSEVDNRKREKKWGQKKDRA